MPALTDGTFTARDGMVLPLRHWGPLDHPRAVIVALHGMSDYSNAFALPGATRAAQGILTLAYDQRGFGAAPGSGLWAGAAMLAALMFYLKLSRKLGYGMFLAFVLLGLVTEGLYRALGPGQLLILAAGVFVAAWIAQFVGHHIEGKRPSFFTDLAYLLIGPAWIVSKLMRRAGIGV